MSPFDMARTASARKPSADQIAAQNIRLEEARYQTLYRPLNQKMMQSLGDGTYLQNVQDNLQVDPAKREARRARELRRYGTQATTLDLKRGQDYQVLENATTETGVLDTARQAQFLRDELMGYELTNIGRGIATSGQQGLDAAAANQVARDNANSAAKAQNSAARTQFMGQMAGLALMAAIAL